MNFRITDASTLRKMDFLQNNDLGNQYRNRSTSPGNDSNTGLGGCPVGRPYPWIYEIPKIFTQQFDSNILPVPPEEIALKVIFYILTVVVALVSNFIRGLPKFLQQHSSNLTHL